MATSLGVCWACTFGIRHPQTTLRGLWWFSSSNFWSRVWWLKSSTRWMSDSAWQREGYPLPWPTRARGMSCWKKHIQLNSGLGKTQVKQVLFLVLLNLCLRAYNQLWEHVWVSSFPWYFFSFFLSYLYIKKGSHRIKFKGVSFSLQIFVVPLILPQNLTTFLPQNT